MQIQDPLMPCHMIHDKILSIAKSANNTFIFANFSFFCFLTNLQFREIYLLGRGASVKVCILIAIFFKYIHINKGISYRNKKFY